MIKKLPKKLPLRKKFAEPRFIRRAQEALEEWRRDPSTDRAYNDIRAELIQAGLLDAEEDDLQNDTPQ